MKYSNRFLRATSLDATDTRILKVAGASPLSIAQLSKMSRLPRSTVAYRLPFLEKRGIVKSEKYGERFKYVAIAEPEVLHKAPVKFDSEITTYRGAEEMTDLWYKITSFPKHSRLYVIQPPNSLRHALRAFKGKDSIRISELVKERFIVDGITHQKSASILISSYDKSKDTSELVQAFKERLEDIVKIPDDFIDEDAEVNIINNHVIFMDWKNRIAVDIHNELIYRFMLSLYAKVKAYGTRHHHGKYIEEISKAI
jgi:DNA-binding Lrp family transcriptional regulator